MFLVNSRSGLFTAATSPSPRVVVPVPVAPLIPKLRGHFAEFLCHGSLEHLRILSSPTCVGLRYGHVKLYLEVFLGSMIESTLRSKLLVIVSRIWDRGFAYGLILHT